MLASLSYLMLVNIVNNLMNISIASSIVVVIHIIGKIAATFATSWACKKEITLGDELKWFELELHPNFVLGSNQILLR